MNPVEARSGHPGTPPRGMDAIEIQRATLETCSSAEGTVVVIDVLRAFTTAAYAFAGGAVEILLAGEVAEALALRQAVPGALLVGEVDGQPVAGFDLSNSPSALARLDLRGRTLIQRTTAGTQGVVRVRRASFLLATGLCNAQATAHAVLRRALESVTLVQTGVHPGGWGDEDVACADLLQAYLEGRPADHVSIIERVRASRSGRHYCDPANPVFPPADLECALQVDRFDFAMQVRSGPVALSMKPIRVSGSPA